jgi:opacity protein-like surface antigen
MNETLITTTFITLISLSMTSGVRADDDHAGLYTSIAGLWVMPEDGDLTIDGVASGEVEFDDAFGASVALGFDLPALPISIEAEYTWRDAETENINITGLGFPVSFDAELGSHAFMLNGVLNLKLGDTPFGVYAGGGVGYVLSTVDLAAVAGLPVEGEEEDFTFAYQFRGGVTLDVTDDIMLFGGVRWFDATEPDFDGVEVELQTLDLEFGVRLYF